MKRNFERAIPPWGDPLLLFEWARSPCGLPSPCYNKTKNFSVRREELKEIYMKSVTYVGELSVTYVTDWTIHEESPGAADTQKGPDGPFC